MRDKTPKIRHKNFYVFVLILVFAFIAVSPVFAQVNADVANLALGTDDVRIIVFSVIRVALSFLGLVAVVLILYGGYLWMTSAGNEDQIDKAKKVLKNALIGLAIILSAFAIVQFVISSLLRATQGPPLPPQTPAAGRVGGGSLGSGIIQSHFPMRDAVDVPRNTRIVITFKEKMNPASIAELIPGVVVEDTPIVTQTTQGSYNYPKFNFDHDNNPLSPALPISALRLKRNDGTPDAIQIIRTENIANSVRESEGDNYLGSDASNTDILVSFTEDLHTFILTPVERTDRSKRALFGSSAESIPYTVYLCGNAPRGGKCASGGLRIFSGASAFQGLFNDYQWAFDVGTEIDETPPQISSVIPSPGSTYPPNVMVQVNFDEAVLPTVASGRTLISGSTVDDPIIKGAQIQPGSFNALRVRETTSQPNEYVSGSWYIANQYMTSEFISNDLCGRSSCGTDIFCLPRSNEIRVDVLASTLAQAGSPASAGLFDGIEDIAGNSLDGNKNGIAQGPGSVLAGTYLSANTFFNLNAEDVSNGDNARFTFNTEADPLLGSAVIERTSPATTLSVSTTGVFINEPIQTTFDRFMATSTLNSSNMYLQGFDQVNGGRWNTWWTISASNINDNAYQYGSSKSIVMHGGFWEKSDYANLISSQVTDLYQNCYYPSAGEGIVQLDGETICNADADSPYCCNGEPSAVPCCVIDQYEMDCSF